jgi:hypothetical protein
MGLAWPKLEDSLSIPGMSRLSPQRDRQQGAAQSKTGAHADQDALDGSAVLLEMALPS